MADERETDITRALVKWMLDNPGICDPKWASPMARAVVANTPSESREPTKRIDGCKHTLARMIDALAGPDFNTEQNLHADTVAERHDSKQEDTRSHDAFTDSDLDELEECFSALNVALQNELPSFSREYIEARRLRMYNLIQELRIAPRSSEADRRDAERWRALKELAGYFQNGSQETVTLYQDDATRSCFIKVGRGDRAKVHGTDGSSFNSVIDALIVSAKAEKP